MNLKSDILPDVTLRKIGRKKVLPNKDSCLMEHETLVCEKKISIAKNFLAV